MPTRRAIVVGGAGLVAGGAALMAWRNSGAANRGDFEIVKTQAEWRKILTSRQFAVLREEATEKPYSSPLNAEKRTGVYACAGCGLDAYSSADKFDSGTGWPSFTRSLPDAVRTQPDRKLIIQRTEVHCRRCGGHFGHIFDDGPPPTGKRHCLNGVALRFKPGVVTGGLSDRG
ncbi:MAG: peptide-methionine (R)-S-oxide reductase MsrB [Beijerinckiaceae bacterium]